MIVVVHRWFGVPRVVADQVKQVLANFGEEAVTIVDVCSGSGGPMLAALELVVAEQDQDRRIDLVLTDLQPPSRLVSELNGSKSSIRYLEWPVNVCLPLMEQLETSVAGGAVQVVDRGASVVDCGASVVRTLVCGFHHLAPEQARLVLLDAQRANQPLVIFELTDGTVPPRWLWWVTLPANFLFGLLVSLFARPVTVHGLAFSFLLPIIPACFAWDGAVTSARTYREAEFYELVKTLPTRDDYQWEFKTVPGAVVQCSLMVGRPIEG